MLGDWQLHKDYQESLKLKLLFHQEMQRSRLVSLDKSISKLYLLNLDNLLPIVKPLYPNFGRPTKNQQGIIRSLVLMLDLQEYSITNWAEKVKSDKLLFDICGFDTQKHHLYLHTMTFYHDYGLILIRIMLKEKLNHDSFTLSLVKS